MAQKLTTPRRPGQRAGLDRERIITAALAVIDEHGIEGLTMRRLGTALGVAPMAMYSHFENKAAVVDAVVDHEAGRMYEIAWDLPTDPIDVLVAISVQLRRVLLDHPKLAPILATRPLPQHQAAFLVHVGALVLRDAGYPPEAIPWVSEMSTRFAIGWALHEAGQTQGHTQMGATFRATNEGILARLARSTEDTSLAQAVVAHRLDEDPAVATAGFEHALRALLAGLKLPGQAPWA